MAAYEVLLLNTAIPQIQAAQSGDTYVVPRDIAINASASITGNLGIGTATPQGPLEVAATGATINQYLTGGTGNNAVTGIFRIGSGAGRGASIQGFRGASSNIHSLDFYAYNAGDVFGMRLTSAGNLGVGETNPAYKLEVNGGASDAMSLFNSTSANGAHLRFAASGTVKSYIGGAPGFLGSGTADDLGIRAVGSILFATAGSGVDMTLDTSGNLGIGTPSPNYIATLYKASLPVLQLANSTSGSTAADGLLIYLNGANATISNEEAGSIGFQTSGTLRVTLDSSGNLGLGVAPSAWASSWRALQTLGGNSFYSDSTVSALASNAIYDGAWKYVNTAGAGTYQINRNAHNWYIAPSGTAGNAITFTQAMTLDASGNLLVGTTSAVGKVTINDGALAFSGNATAPATNVGIYRGGAADNLIFATGGSERARITSGGIFQVSSGGSVQVGGTAARATTAGTNRLDIFNGTAPVGTLTNGISIYSSSGEAYVMDAAGNATLFSPHDAETNEWIFKSKHTPTGKVLKIDVERLLKFVNDHFGLDAVHEFVEE